VVKVDYLEVLMQLTVLQTEVAAAAAACLVVHRQVQAVPVSSSSSMPLQNTLMYLISVPFLETPS
jgi:hypothetical protein